MGYEFVRQLYLSDVLFDFLTPPSMSQPTDVLLCPEQIDNLKRVFDELSVPYEVMVLDLQT